ncbi:hypothetical protein ACQJBY_015972 [Aegilops geniculata]
MYLAALKEINELMSSFFLCRPDQVLLCRRRRCLLHPMGAAAATSLDPIGPVGSRRWRTTREDPAGSHPRRQFWIAAAADPLLSHARCHGWRPPARDPQTPISALPFSEDTQLAPRSVGSKYAPLRGVH